MENTKSSLKFKLQFEKNIYSKDCNTHCEADVQL